MASAMDSSSARSRLSKAFKSGRKKGTSAENSDRDETSSNTTSERHNSPGSPTVGRTGSYPRPTSRRGSESSNRNRKSPVLLKRRPKKQANEAASPLQQDDSLPYIATQNSSRNDLELDDNASGSLLTEDSEEPQPVRPSLSPHHSHSGYLTLSSPSIQVELVDTDNSVPAAPSLPNISADSLVVGKTPPLDSPPSSLGRSPSPARRLREALVLSKKTSSSDLRDTDTSPSPVPPVDAESGGKLKALIDRGRRGSSSSRRNLKALGEDRPTAAPSFQKPQPIRPTPYSAVDANDQPSTPPRDRIDGPTTLVTPPTPTGPREQDQSTPTPGGKKGIASPLDFPTPPARTASPPTRGHVRNKSGSAGPSKLSNAIGPPLTPALEEVKAPGGGLVAPSAAGGFFSSMFSAAQNAANSLTNTITSSTSNQRSKSGTVQGETSASESAFTEENGTQESGTEDSAGQTEKRQRAVDTLGSGNLSLSHLGILDTTDSSAMTSKSDNLEHPEISALRKDDFAAKSDDDGVARTVYTAYEKIDGEKSTAPSVASGGDLAKTSPPEEPPLSRSLAEPDTGSIKRAGSVRSRLSSSRRRRTRGSSAATGTTAAPLQVNGVQRPQGFAVANQKRNRDFHNLFKSVPEDDLLIEDYSAALQREILLHGRLYVSEGHICFSSNILGWVTNLVVSFDEIISVEKKSTAVIFQNGIVISTVHARNVFASLLNRDSTYELIISMWKATHPNLKSTLNGSAVEGGGTGDKTEKAGSTADADSASEEVYDQDDSTDDEGDIDRSVDAAGDESFAGSEGGGATVSRNASAAVGGATANGSTKPIESSQTVAASGPAIDDFPGPPTHESTDCGDSATHYDKILMDTTIPAPLGKIYSLLFGPSMGTFMRKWLIEDQKSTNLQLDDDKKGLGVDKKEMSFSYIKPLSGGIGPKQTTCNITMTLEQFDLEKAVTVGCVTQNPDVPSGNAFVTKTRYCLMWGPSNSTRLIMNYNIEWSGKSWIKGPIEKGTADGQLQYAKDLVAALKAAVTTKSAAKSGAQGKARGPKRRRNTPDGGDAEADASVSGAVGAKQAQNNWTVLESRSTLLIIASVSVLLAVVFFLLGSRWGTSGRLPDRYGGVQYERVWATEENELWRWLEERVGLEHSAPAIFPSGSKEQRKEERIFQRDTKDMQQKLAAEKMSERQVIEAIEMTRQRLKVLENAVKRSHAESTADVAKEEASADAESVR